MRLLIRSLQFIATHWPIRWAAEWHDRVTEADFRELLADEPVQLRSVLPWAVRPHRGGHSTREWLDGPSCQSDSASSAASDKETSPEGLAAQLAEAR